MLLCCCVVVISVALRGGAVGAFPTLQHGREWGKSYCACFLCLQRRAKCLISNHQGNLVHQRLCIAAARRRGAQL